MTKIIKLDKILANQIAAGEVVERPFSAVKELVENSIDAKATSIKVEIKNGGIEEIIITDNGTGISKENLENIAEKYSTSKIKNLDDLYTIMTFGFRGEALASISSVSDMQIISKIKDGNGYILNIIGGEKQEIKEIACQEGTKIIIKNLFYNTPARLNYLKKPRTEYSYILKYLQEISLVYPEISFEFINDEKINFIYREESQENRIYNVFGEDFSKNLLKINFEMIGMKVSGFISDPKVSFKNKDKQIIFVNKRPVKSILISKAIFDAYNRFIPHSSEPAYILNLEIIPTEVDVNVHPRKLEVRFANEQNIFRIFYHSIEGKLNSVSLINTNDEDISKNFEENFENKSEESKIFSQTSQNLHINNNKSQVSKEKYYVPSGTKFKDYSPYKNTTVNPGQSTISNAISFTEKILENKNSLEDLNLTNDLHFTKLGKIIGQSHNSYIIVENGNSLQIYDQHALAERINYEKLVKKSEENGQNSQWLLIGENISLGPKEMDILEENLETFTEMGFDIEILAGNNLIVNGIPSFIKKENLKEIFLGIIDDIGEYNFSKSKTLDEVKNKIFAYTACRSAIKFGNKLSLFEMNKLLNDAYVDYSATCPHGRPVIFEINLEDLKNKYER